MRTTFDSVQHTIPEKNLYKCFQNYLSNMSQFASYKDKDKDTLFQVNITHS